jgi:tetratricopeptide (TPR) repeat protein
MSTELGDDLRAPRAPVARLGLQQRAEYEKAESEFNRAGTLLGAVNSPRDEVIHLTYVGELNYRMGDHDRSAVVLRRALEKAEKIGSGTTLAGRVMRHLAELAVRTGDFRSAQKLAARASVIMERPTKKSTGRPQESWLGTARRCPPGGRTSAAEARQLFQKAIDILDESVVSKSRSLLAAGSSRLSPTNSG